MKGFRLYTVIGKFAACSSVGVLPRDETKISLTCLGVGNPLVGLDKHGFLHSRLTA